MLDWARLLSERRLKGDTSSSPVALPDWFVQSRTEAERDFDRILFATPTRRLGDKTQVFPLEKNESVRTRLTHSHEVANLARSVGRYLASGAVGEKILTSASAATPQVQNRARRALPAILAAAGLAHDLGNPPFGHQGEDAIAAWVVRNHLKLFDAAHQKNADTEYETAARADVAHLTEDHKQDFIRFEGNAQAFRTITRLQVVKDDRGLNLTFGTLAAMLKYPVGSSSRKKGGPAAFKKHGFFVSERRLVDAVHAETGLKIGTRHPLTFLVEACDDIAYTVVDAEDAVKKQIVSFADLAVWLRSKAAKDEVVSWVLARAELAAEQARTSGLPPAEVNDVAMQVFRASALDALMSGLIRTFETEFDSLSAGEFESALLSKTRGHAFCEALREFDSLNAYRNRRVLEIELRGFNTINGLMDMLWRAITERENFEKLSSGRTSPFARYAYSRISENYKRVFEGRLEARNHSDAELPIRYRELQLLTDMVAGMTDSYAIDLYDELKEHDVGASHVG